MIDQTVKHGINIDCFAYTSALKSGLSHDTLTQVLEDYEIFLAYKSLKRVKISLFRELLR